MELRPHGLTAALSIGYSEFDRDHEISPCWSLPVLYPPMHCLCDASPKAVSERTSYSQIRLAFHSLPQVIPRRCTTNGFGPPFVFRQTSSCSWQAHLASGRIYTTDALFTLGFPMAASVKGFSRAIYIHSPAHSSIGTPSR